LPFPWTSTPIPRTTAAHPTGRPADDPPVAQTDTSDEAGRDARSLIVMLEARLADMSGE
jgi:hypothetical protein